MHETIAPTPETVRHLNIEVNYKPSGEIISAKTRNRYLAEHLLDKGFLDEYHIEYGISLLSLRDVWLGKLNARAMPLFDHMRVLRSIGSPTEIYDHVVRITKPKYARIVIQAMEIPAKEIVALEGQIYRIAFDILVDAFAEAHKQLAKDREKA